MGYYTRLCIIIAIDIFHGCIDSIKGFHFFFQLDTKEQEINATPAVRRPKTVLQLRREKEGIQSPQTGEKVVLTRSPAYVKLLWIYVVNLSVIIGSVALLWGFSAISSLCPYDFVKTFLEHCPYLFIFPVYLGTRIVNALLFSDIAGACYRHLRMPDAPYVDFKLMASDAIASTIVQVLFIIQGIVVEQIPIPVVSKILMYVHTALLTSSYSFEYFWFSRSVLMTERFSRIERRWAYFVGFGIPLTIAISISSNVIVNGCIFAILFPFFIISSFKAYWDRKYDVEIPPFKIFSIVHACSERVGVVMGNWIMGRMM